MNKVKFKIGKKHTRGDRKGNRFTETVQFNSPEDIHAFLWEATSLYDKERCHFIIEWYRKM